MIPTSNDNPEQISAYQMEQIERLASNYRGEIKVYQIHDMHNWTSDEANEFIEILSKNQLNPVTERGRYSATELNAHLKKLM